MPSPLHQSLVSSLVSKLAYGCEITHAAGVGTLPDPPKVGRHEPDLLGHAGDQTIIGEAKIGTDLTAQTSREQLADFSTHVGPNGERATFWLCVPTGWREQAEKAIVDAGGELHERVDILTVDLPDAPKPPEPAELSDPASEQSDSS